MVNIIFFIHGCTHCCAVLATFPRNCKWKFLLGQSFSSYLIEWLESLTSVYISAAFCQFHWWKAESLFIFIILHTHLKLNLLNLRHIEKDSKEAPASKTNMEMDTTFTANIGQVYTSFSESHNVILRIAL